MKTVFIFNLVEKHKSIILRILLIWCHFKINITIFSAAANDCYSSRDCQIVGIQTTIIIFVGKTLLT